MNASLKLAYSEARIDPYQLAQLKTLDEKDKTDVVKMESLKLRKIEIGREISEIHEALTRRDNQRKKILRGEVIIPPLEDAIDE